MSLENKQPLVTLEISLDLQVLNRAGISIKPIIGLSDKITEKVQDIMTLIQPNLIIVDVARSAAHITSFECNPLGGAVISAIFQGYIKNDKS